MHRQRFFIDYRLCRNRTEGITRPLRGHLYRISSGNDIEQQGVRTFSDYRIAHRSISGIVQRDFIRIGFFDGWPCKSHRERFFTGKSFETCRRQQLPRAGRHRGIGRSAVVGKRTHFHRISGSRDKSRYKIGSICDRRIFYRFSSIGIHNDDVIEFDPYGIPRHLEFGLAGYLIGYIFRGRDATGYDRNLFGGETFIIGPESYFITPGRVETGIDRRRSAGYIPGL